MNEYKRLTKKEGIGRFVKSDCITCKHHKDDITGCDFCGGDEMCNKWCCGVLYNRLAELEDKIENKTLMELPCKVGDKVYCIYHFDYVEEDFEYDIIPEEVVDIIVQEDDFDIGTACRMIGKFQRIDVCLTKAEAEKKLKELQNERKRKA